MRVRGRLIVFATALFVLTTIAVVILARLEPRPSLAEIAGLAGAGKLDDAELRLAVLLEHRPRDPEANLLAAQIKMGRCEQVTNSGIGPDPQPATAALEILGRVDFEDKKLAALASLWRGKAERYRGQLEEAEASWLEALRLDPTVPEAGWLLLQEYYLQLRTEEVRTLALRLHRNEPDGRDRILFLMEPLRQDVMPPAPASLVLWFEPIATRFPTGLRANIALGLALVRSSEMDRGMDLLRKVVELYPGRPEAWNALLAGLDEMGDVKVLSEVVQSLPSDFSSSPWIFKYRGCIDEDRGDWTAAVSDYRRALKTSPTDPRLEYCLARALRRIGERAEADRLDGQHQAREAMKQESRALYEIAINDFSTGPPPHPELYEKIAVLREKMGYPEQAEAWRRLASPASLGN